MAQSLAAGAAPNGAFAAEQQDMLPVKQLIPILAGLILGMLLAALDQTVVGTALPRVVKDLGGQSNISWVLTSYLLASTVMVPIYGKLSDIYGRRLFFIIGMVLFLAGSALSGTSQNMTQLIIYRGIQGLGAGALMPIAQAIIGDIFPPAERGKWQGLFTAVFGLATILGPLLGGYITDNWGWRWTFYVNMPIGVIALIVAAITLPAHGRRRQHTIDYWGSAALVAWSVPLLLAVSLGGKQYAWDSVQIIGLFVAAIVMLGVFFAIEMRAAEPIISPRLFKNRIFSISVLAMFLLSAGMFGAIAYLPIFIQYVLNQSATNSGLVLTPMMLGFMVSSIAGGFLLARTGRYKALALGGFAVAVVGMFLLSRTGLHTSNQVLVRDMVIMGLGIGVMMSLFTIVVQNAFPLRQMGEVTATLSFFRSMGGTIGLAALGAVLNNTLQSNLIAQIPAALKPFVNIDKLSNGDKTAVDVPGVAAHLGQQGLALLANLPDIYRTSFATAMQDVFLIGTAALAVAFVATIFLKEIPLRKTRLPGQPTVTEDGQPVAAESEAEPEVLEPSMAL